jgi:hypothetical protein
VTPTTRDVAVAVMEETSRGSRAAIDTFLRGSPVEAKGSAQFATLPLPRYAAFSLSTSRERFASQNSETENHMQKRIASAGTTLTHWCPSPTPSNPQKHPAHDGRDAAGDPVHRPLDWTSGTVERRETCMNKRIKAIVVTPPAPSRELPSARTAPVARRLTPTLEPTLSERELTS